MATRPARANDIAGDVIDLRTDDELAQRAAVGDNGAFEDLYVRHSAASWRVAQAVTGNRDDAADAVSEAFTRVLAALSQGRMASGAPFRPYLLVTTRNAAIDVLRRSGRTRPTDEVPELERAGSPAMPADKLLAGVDAALVAQAFRDLPERWRSVLWLTEVEGIPPREAAPMLGLSPNGAAQLAVRARAGLRERYLQAHLRSAPDRACRFTIDHLGAYVGGGLSPRDIAKVDQHLAGCEACRVRLAELEDVGSTLRRIVLPIPIGMGILTLTKWKEWLLASAGKESARRAGGLVLGGAERMLAGASAGLFLLGIFGAGVIATRDDDGSGRRPTGIAEVATQPLDPPVVEGFTVTAPVAAANTRDTDGTGGGAGARGNRDGRNDRVGDGRRAGETPRADDAAPAAPAPTTPPTTAPPPPTTTTPPAPQPAAQVEAVASAGDPNTAAVAVGVGDGSCTGILVGTTVTGCAPAGSGEPGVSIETSGSLLPPAQIP